MPMRPLLKVLENGDLQKIHNLTLRVLESTGVAFHCEEVLELFKANGFKVEGRTVFFTRNQIEKSLETCGVTMPGDLYFAEHHESHAASAFFPSPFQTRRASLRKNSSPVAS